MKFLAPEALWLLALLPVMLAGYIALLHRRRVAVRYTSLMIVREALSPARRYRQHLPFAALLSALALCIVAVARPATLLTTPSHERTIILAIDVSSSMEVRDVGSSRLQAAQVAARTFIRSQPPGVRIGIVAFSGTADLVQSPTPDHQDVIAALDRLYLQADTSIGVGLFAAMLTLFPHESFGGNLDLFGMGKAPADIDPLSGRLAAMNHRRSAEQRAPGSHPSASIVLLTDGRDTMGPQIWRAVKVASERGVRVYTVGFGNARHHPDAARSTGPDVSLNEAALRSIANATHGEYFHASTARGLERIYRNLTGRIVLVSVKTEVTALVAAMGALILMLAGLLSMLWSSRAPDPAPMPKSMAATLTDALRSLGEHARRHPRSRVAVSETR